MGDAGQDDRDVRKFYRKLRGNSPSGEKESRRIIERALDERMFKEVNDLNTQLMKKGAEYEGTHAFLLAVHNPSLSLWHVDEFGNLHEAPEENDFDYIALGSGKKEAIGYIERIVAEEKIDRDSITLPVALRAAREAIRAATKEAYTGLGYDLVVIIKGSIKEWGPEIGKALDVAERVKVDEIVEHYKKIPFDSSDKD